MYALAQIGEDSVISTEGSPPCVRLKCDIERQAMRTSEESPSKKAARQTASSRARLTYMSPNSQAQCQRKQAAKRFVDKHKMERYEVDIPLDTEQDDEMSAVVSKIEEVCSDELQKLFKEGEKHGVGLKLRNTWNTDKRREYTEFNRDQVINSKLNFMSTSVHVPDIIETGKRGNRWSSITIRMGMITMQFVMINSISLVYYSTCNIYQKPSSVRSAEIFQNFTFTITLNLTSIYWCISPCSWS